MMSLSALMALGSAVVILLIGFRVYLFDRGKYQYRAFAAMCALFAWTCFCWFGIEQATSVEPATFWRKMQSVRVLGFPLVLYCCWRFANNYLQHLAFWFKVVFMTFFVLPAWIFLGMDVFLQMGHGTIVVLPNGDWGLVFPEQRGFTLVRSIWIVLNYLLSLSLIRVAWTNERIGFRKSRIQFLQIMLLCTISVSILQNYLLKISGLVMPINESWVMLIIAALLGWAISDFQLFDLKPESAFEHVAGSMNNLLIITDLNFQIKSINEAALKFFNTSSREARNAGLDKIIGEKAAGVLTSNLNHGSKQELGFLQGQKRARILFTTSLMQNRYGGTLGYVFVGNDLTDYYQALEEVQHYNARLQASNQSLEHFAYAVSHDLKEPLRTINGFATLLDRKMTHRDDEDVREYLGFVNQGIVRMNALIDSILTLSRLGHEQEADECVNLERVVLEINHKLSALRQHKNASVEFSGDFPVIYGKYYQVSLLFQNLIENGIKYNRNTEPLVKVHWVKIPEGYQFAVQDNGIGIEPRYHQQVFQMFKRLHSWAEYEGSGIGLTMCRKIVEGLGGRIWIESPTNGGGTIFHFVIPERLAAAVGA